MIRPDVFDDTDRRASDYHWSEPSTFIDWQADHTAELNATIAALQGDLSKARTQRDIWWPLAFCVGVIFGVGLAVLW